jgi:hypothetical protein
VNDSLKIDLHTHSNQSDGALSPQALVERAHQAGINVLALTDHDSIAGIEAAAEAARAVGMSLVPGVEISTAWRAQAIHVLGLWIDPTSPALQGALAAQAERRKERMRTICGRLSKARLPGEALLRAVSGIPGVATRTHLAQAMVDEGVVERTDEAFRKYLGKGKCGHVAVDWPGLAEGIAWITAAGGVAVLAHPCRYGLSAGARRRFLTDFVTAGGKGIEVLSGGNSLQHLESCTRMAETHGLLGSVGSDFHSPQFAWNPIGRSLKLPDCITPIWRGRLP